MSGRHAASTSGLRLGRRPATPERARLKLAQVLSGTLPAVPLQVDYLALGGWAMLGNNRWGDCVAVTWANERRVLSRLAGRESYPGQDDVVALYKTQNPGFPEQDEGMVIQQCLDYLRTMGGPDGTRALAFAEVDHRNLSEVKAALAIFGVLWVGVEVTAANMQQFDGEQPWDYVPRSRDEGGHSVVAGGYDSDGAGGDVRFITWAAETSFTDEFWANQVAEAWVVIWPEHLGTRQFMEGIDQRALGEAFQQLTGQPFPTYGPAPQPTPQPVPAVVDPRDEALAAVATPWVTQHRHSGLAREVARALQQWLHDRGLATVDAPEPEPGE